MGMRRPYCIVAEAHRMVNVSMLTAAWVCPFDTYDRQCYHSHTKNVIEEVFSGVKPLRSIVYESVGNNHQGCGPVSLLGGGKHAHILFDSGDGEAHGLGG